MYNTIKKYISAFSVSGNESPLAKIICDDIAPYCDSVEIDPIGNVIAFKKGADSTKRLMIASHMDEIGFMVTYIEESGLIRVTNVGGINAVASSYGTVVFANGVKGIIVLDMGAKKEDISVKSMVVDIGAKNKAQAEKKVKIGDVCALEQRITRLMNSRIAAKAFDDRLACAITFEAAKLIEEPAYDTYYVFTVQEEVGCRGSKPAAFGIAPTYGIALDVTHTGDMVGGPKMTVKLGEGAAIKIKDSSVICSRKMIDRLTELAEAEKIKYQYEVLLAGGTDTSAMQLAGAGSYACCISLPTRYTHTPVETIDINDMEAC
ncbi:MAG: M20/M25/M40 family metallo-hydrolase, partial [Clostridia bacterium]|nr:M20/M25/M40 family metallo-hydrolase [Clostridia bacterium]